MADLVIASTRGGMNNTDPAISLPDNQCVTATNVEWVNSMLGERRKGTSAVTLPAFLSGKSRVVFLHRHLPTADETAAELIALGIDTTYALGRKTSAWSEVTISDTPNTAQPQQNRWAAVSIHGKLHLAYDSDVDRLHVMDADGTMRRSGLAEPAAPTAADSGGAGALAGTRYYRVRYTVKSGSTTLRRSEFSDTLTHTPGGANASITITKPASISEGETHWELEASLDNANFYILATTVVGTTTVTDSTAFSTGYSAGALSEDTGDYALIPSARYLTHDDDRLIWAGSWENEAYAARVGWTPVYNADGVGNDERFETDTDPFKDLDTYEGGPITGLSEPVLGGIWVFKQRGIYKLTRTSLRRNAYDADKYSDVLGAVPGSVVTAVDETGSPCVYFIDAQQGPCRIGYGGIKRCGEDLRITWETLNVSALAVVCNGLFYPAKKQVHWNVSLGTANTPATRIVLHTDKSRTTADGVRGGWAIWNGTISQAMAMCLFADNIEDNTSRSLKLVPFIGLNAATDADMIQLCDTGVDDNGTAYAAQITTKPYTLVNILRQFIVHSGALLAKAVSGAAITISAVRDFAAETTATVSSVSLAATGTETDVIKPLDSLTGSEFRVVQFTITDVASPTATWELNQLAVREEAGQGA
jgi:hypothetical protein